jgi:hypothetical protein
MFGLKCNDSELYAMVVSAQLKRDIIVRNVFDRGEVDKLLSKAI